MNLLRRRAGVGGTLALFGLVGMPVSFFAFGSLTALVVLAVVAIIGGIVWGMRAAGAIAAAVGLLLGMCAVLGLLGHEGGESNVMLMALLVACGALVFGGLTMTIKVGPEAREARRQRFW